MEAGSATAGLNDRFFLTSFIGVRSKENGNTFAVIYANPCHLASETLRRTSSIMRDIRGGQY